jgi:hypothetical protein
MHQVIENFNLDLPFPDVFPSEWASMIQPCDFMAFRNLDHFKFVVSKLKQKNDTQCGMTYADALTRLLEGQSDFPKEEQASIRNLVRENLHKRGLLTQEVYENFRYTTDGTKVDVDVGKYTAGEPDCVITPSRQYIDFFYELYISISYPYGVADSLVRKNTAKLLATIEELERQHIFIKITLIFPDRGCVIRDEDNKGRSNFVSAIPLFSHKEPKSVDTMSSVVNERLLRKFYFAILEDLYGDNLASSYGHALEIDTAMNIGKEFNEVEFFESIVNSVGA